MKNVQFARLFIVLLFSLCLIANVFPQKKMSVDGKFGLHFATGNGSASGLLIGGGLDIPMDNNLYIRPELNITTLSGTPIELAGSIKYFVPNTMSQTPLYIDGGAGIWFHSGGTALGIDFGGGAIFPLSGSKLSIPAEIKMGPVIESGSSYFQISLTSGIRFDLP